MIISKHILVHKRISIKYLFFLSSFLILSFSLSQDYVDRILELTKLDLLNSSFQIQEGARVYNLVCADCHGDTGLGFDEALLGFHPDHHNCSQCHRKYNSPHEDDVRVSERNCFNIGDPPAIRGEGLQKKFQNAAAYYYFIKATMPRYMPNGLSEQEYWNITAFLLAINDNLPDQTELSIENAAQITLH